MKTIVAIIKPFKPDDGRNALNGLEIAGSRAPWRGSDRVAAGVYKKSFREDIHVC